MKKNVVNVNEDTLRQMIAESITNYFKQDGDYYGNDSAINGKKGWFVYLFKDSMTGEPAAEITKANLKNFSRNTKTLLSGVSQRGLKKLHQGMKMGIYELTPLKLMDMTTTSHPAKVMKKA